MWNPNIYSDCLQNPPQWTDSSDIQSNLIYLDMQCSIFCFKYSDDSWARFKHWRRLMNQYDFHFLFVAYNNDFITQMLWRNCHDECLIHDFIAFVSVTLEKMGSLCPDLLITILEKDISKYRNANHCQKLINSMRMLQIAAANEGWYKENSIKYSKSNSLIFVYCFENGRGLMFDSLKANITTSAMSSCIDIHNILVFEQLDLHHIFKNCS